MSEDVKGKIDEAKGRGKKAAGDVTGSDQLHREGEVDEKAGKARQKLGEATERVGEQIDKAAEKAREMLRRDGDR